MPCMHLLVVIKTLDRLHEMSLSKCRMPDCTKGHSDGIWAPVLYQVTSGHYSAILHAISHHAWFASIVHCNVKKAIVALWRATLCSVPSFSDWWGCMETCLTQGTRRSPSCQSHRTCGGGDGRYLTDFASSEWIHALWSILQSFHTGCTGCKIIAHSALFSL